MFRTILSTVTLCLLGLTSAGFAKGSCPKVALQENFDVSSYTGVWYEQARDKAFPQEKFDCNTASYSLNNDNSLKVHNQEYDFTSGKFNDIIGKATCDAKDKSRCKVDFNLGFAGDYRVVATDYTSYAIVYSCEEVPLLGRAELTWVLSRTPKISNDAEVTVRAFLNERLPFYNLDQFHSAIQGGQCPYYFSE